MTQLYITPETTRATCANCDWRGSTDDLDMISDAEQRLEAGYITPAGQCPKCGALAYLTDKTAPKHSQQFRLYMLEKEQDKRNKAEESILNSLDHSLQSWAVNHVHLTGSAFGRALASAWFHGGPKQRARLAVAFPDVFEKSAKNARDYNAKITGAAAMRLNANVAEA